LLLKEVPEFVPPYAIANGVVSVRELKETSEFVAISCGKLKVGLPDSPVGLVIEI